MSKLELINVGLTKKVGQPNYSSLGVSCHFEVKPDKDALEKPDELKAYIRSLFALCTSAIEDELSKQEILSDLAKRLEDGMGAIKKAKSTAELNKIVQYANSVPFTQTQHEELRSAAAERLEILSKKGE